MRRRVALFGVSLTVTATAVVAVAQAVSSQSDAEKQPVAIGIVRGDGIMFPLAQLHDNVWMPLRSESETPDGSSRSHLTAAGRRFSSTEWTAFPGSHSGSPALCSRAREVHVPDVSGLRWPGRWRTCCCSI